MLVCYTDRYTFVYPHALLLIQKTKALQEPLAAHAGESQAVLFAL